jgi:hypothetical protein
MVHIYQNTAQKNSLTEKERTALIHLLDDEDQNIYLHIRQKLIECGPEICRLLKLNSIKATPLLRRRANEIINYFGRQVADDIFLAFCLKNW